MLQDLEVINTPEQHEKIKSLSCRVPFNSLQIYDNGEVTNCCYSWMPKVVGNVTENSLLSLIHSDAQKDIQESVRNRSFKYCDCTLCPSLATYINQGNLVWPVYQGKAQDAMMKTIKIYFSYDKSCNLRCPSCRNDYIHFNTANMPPRLQKIHNSVLSSIEELLQAGYHLDLNITGSGDPFASALYSDLLQNIPEHPHLSVSLQTNGVLMNESRWNPRLRKLLTFLNVSVDAATPETYERVRIGGRFPAMLKNVKIFDDMVSEGAFPRLGGWQVNFIVQKDNYFEIPPFLEWALGHKTLKTVWFNLIADWGHLTKEAFEEKAIWRADHPAHAHFKEVLKCDLLRDSRVYLGNMAYYVPSAVESADQMALAHAPQ